MQIVQRRRDVGEMAGEPTPFSSYLEGNITSNQRNTYRIAMLLDGYPQEMPLAYVVEPSLRQADGTGLARMGGSQPMHTLPPDVYGHVQMCLVNDRTWRTTTTLVSLVMRARVWVEAYEAYLDTGTPLDRFLGHG